MSEQNKTLNVTIQNGAPLYESVLSMIIWRTKTLEERIIKLIINN